MVWIARRYPELYINDETKESVLHFAAGQGLKEVVRYLLKTGSFPVDTRDDGEKTPLHHAAISGQEEVFKFLVENKVPVFTQLMALLLLNPSHRAGHFTEAGD